MNKVSISIVTWNSAETIAACIESVLAQTFQEFELIVTDNNSVDDTLSKVEGFSDHRIRVNPLTTNTGFCGGHNLALKQSDSEFVLLVNPDIIMSPDYLEQALIKLEAYPRAGTHCGLLIQSRPTDENCVIDSAGLDLLPSRTMAMRFHGQLLRSVVLQEQEVFGADGALPLYRRAMIDDISMQGEFFDQMFFAHKEDWDVSWRSHIYGWMTIFDPLCIAIHPRHFKPQSLRLRRKIAGHIKLHAVKNQLLLLLKNESLTSFLIHSVYIVPRQLVIFLYILCFERTSLQAYTYVFRNLRTIMAKRAIIQRRKKEQTKPAQ